MEMDKLIVTGGAGFIGSNLVDALIELGFKVTIIDDLSTGKIENINNKCDFIQADIREIPDDLLFNLFKNHSYIFHLAAKARVQPSIENPILYNDHNVNVTLKLLEAARKANIKKFIFSSSSSVYGNQLPPLKETMPTNPLSPYGLQKLIGEQYCKLYSILYNLDTVSLRYFNVYGKRQPTSGAYCTVLGIFAQQRQQGQPLTIRNNGEQKRDFTNIADVVQANILAMKHPDKLNGECFNIGYGDSISINKIADWFETKKIYSGSVIEPFETLAENTKAKQILGWKPSIKLTKEFIKSL